MSDNLNGPGIDHMEAKFLFVPQVSGVLDIKVTKIWTIWREYGQMCQSVNRHF